MKNLSTFVLCGLLCLGLLGCGSNNQADTPANTAESTTSVSESGNSEDAAKTTVEVPDWVVDILEADPIETRVIKCLYKKQNMYLINRCISCPIQLTEVFDDDQNMVCRIGGADQKITCANDFGRPGNRDCKPVFLK
ncbi:MAG: hypothetical protein AAFP19_02280 [Bacteroidota bacterium]